MSLEPDTGVQSLTNTTVRSSIRANGHDGPFEGEGFAYDVTRQVLATWSLFGKFGGTVATQTFRLQKGDENSHGDITWKVVEMRGRRLWGTVYGGDEVELRGRIDSSGIVRANYVRDKTTGAIVHGWRPPLPWLKILGGILLAVGILALAFMAHPSLEDRIYVFGGVSAISLLAGVLLLLWMPRHEGELAAEGEVQMEINGRVETHWWSRTISILNFKIDNLTSDPPGPGDTRIKMVEIRAPWLRGAVYPGDHVEAWGTVGSDNVVRAVRIENKTTDVTVQAYRPPPPWLKIMGVIFFVVGTMLFVPSIGLIWNDLLGEPTTWVRPFVDWLGWSIFLPSAVSFVAGIVLLIRGVILLMRKKAAGLALAVGGILLVPMIPASVVWINEFWRTEAGSPIRNLIWQLFGSVGVENTETVLVNFSLVGVGGLLFFGIALLIWGVIRLIRGRPSVLRGRPGVISLAFGAMYLIPAILLLVVYWGLENVTERSWSGYPVISVVFIIVGAFLIRWEPEHA